MVKYIYSINIKRFRFQTMAEVTSPSKDVVIATSFSSEDSSTSGLVAQLLSALTDTITSRDTFQLAQTASQPMKSSLEQVCEINAFNLIRSL